MKIMNEKPVIRGKWLELTLNEVHQGKTVEAILKEDLALSGRMIQRLTRQKGLFLNRKAPFLKKKGKKGDVLRVLIGDREEGGLTPENIPIDITYEDHEVLVINKQPGLIVHPIKPDQQGTLANGIAFYLASKGTPGKVRPVHRLDKDTSGLILIAKNSYIHHLLDKQLRENVIHREYLVLVKGKLADQQGTIREPIGQDPENPVKRKVVSTGEEAITHFQVEKEFAECSLLRVRLETGRTHQIRVHFNHIGHPVLGDTLYGNPHPHIRRQALHAYQLQFVHPLREELMSFTEEPLEDFQKLMEFEQKKGAVAKE
ncbi:tRNA pseudouridine32 synthase/23S rRNA pseudouridine746 synthase/23S rRNA pseudouridine1911/1915/1917 synthase [Ammoniphilus resinae]|uniref:Pseudouridine synthase n=1 Tax=Ammoniphilus resinae TaxID=861532 RepID=A0ABS4GV10_9BACL|nr:tRNA pseudouridine32 synthase/23S rRNA pseudouridine746 synthase/23S rRNA pseudouridine1911/1915/1917 synthase [Ammoniphilus resinae]